jgi:hypothetical protein
MRCEAETSGIDRPVGRVEWGRRRAAGAFFFSCGPVDFIIDKEWVV